MTWANSQLWEKYISYFQKNKADIVAIFNSTQIHKQEYVYPLQCNLQDTVATKKAILSLFSNNSTLDIKHYDKIILMHLVGWFEYEWLQLDQKIFHNTYRSNVTTFENIYQTLQEYICINKIKIPEIILFNIWSISDKNVWRNPWPSYSIAKNIIRKRFEQEVNFATAKWNIINALVINAGTVDMDKEKNLRPYADHDFWLSRDEVFEKTIQELETVKWYKEIEIYKPHPSYESKYMNETLIDTHTRWLVEMGK